VSESQLAASFKSQTTCVRNISRAAPLKYMRIILSNERLRPAAAFLMVQLISGGKSLRARTKVGCSAQKCGNLKLRAHQDINKSSSKYSAFFVYFLCLHSNLSICYLPRLIFFVFIDMEQQHLNNLKSFSCFPSTKTRN